MLIGFETVPDFSIKIGSISSRWVDSINSSSSSSSRWVSSLSWVNSSSDDCDAMRVSRLEVYMYVRETET